MHKHQAQVNILTTRTRATQSMRTKVEVTQAMMGTLVRTEMRSRLSRVVRMVKVAQMKVEHLPSQKGQGQMDSMPNLQQPGSAQDATTWIQRLGSSVMGLRKGRCACLQGLATRGTEWLGSSQICRAGTVIGIASTAGTRISNSGTSATGAGCPRTTRRATSSGSWKRTSVTTLMSNLVLVQ